MAFPRQQYILVGIETDPTFYHGEHARAPAVLDASQCEKVLAHIAVELDVIWPEAMDSTLAMAGGLFDQAQVLRPNLPLFKTLQSLVQDAAPERQPGTRLMAFGADDGIMPGTALQPDRRIPPGALQLLPLLLSCPNGDGAGPQTDIDSLFYAHGQLSRAAAAVIGECFGVVVDNARFMTPGQLSVLLRRQLESQELLSLWELLDAAMEPSGETLEVRTGHGARFTWREDAMHGYFETFDWWANHGAGTREVAQSGHLQAAYANWTREYRHYQRVLAEHGISLSLHLPGCDDSTLDDAFLVEESTMMPDPASARLTEHGAGALGTVVVTVVDGQRQMNLYPLRPDGINDLHRYIREQGFAGDIAYPGHICYDATSRRLVADTLPPRTD